MRSVSMVLAVLVFAIPAVAGAQVTYSNRPPPPPNHYPNPPTYPANSSQVVSCGSSDNRPASCRVPSNWRGVRIVQQTSHSACVQGRTWGFQNGTIWVNNGCRARFAAAAGGWQPGPGWNRDIQLSCGSPQYRYAFCQVDVGARGRVVIQRQISDTRCVEGRNWGWNRAGVWVNDGCSARFTVIRRW